MNQQIFKYLKLGSFLILWSISSLVFSQDLANCSAPSGYAYYHHIGSIKKSDSGWDKDKISKGKTTLVKIDKENFDLLYVDSNDKITSSVQSGALVKVIRKSRDNFSAIVMYPNDTIEIYTFFKNNEGKLEYTHLQSKGGDAFIHKSSVMAGSCSYINFNF